MKKINIGILGYGTIGSSVDELIRKNHDLIQKRTGLDLQVLKVCDNSTKVKHKFLTKDPFDVIQDDQIDVVVEAIGGERPALNFILAAIKSGKNVVTSNKEVIALHGDEILELAKEKGVSVKFEAAVGGGIPIIGPLSHDLLSNEIEEVYGIVNGTTNYILSKMTKEEAEFSDVLKEAQKLGFAESNPKKDIEGYDSSYKAAILASIAFNSSIDWKDVFFEGIDKIEQEDIVYAKEIGYVIKLLAIAKKSDTSCEVRVHPTLIAQDHPLASVFGPMNAIYVKGNMVGELMFYGQGAGGNPTASAVVSDIIFCANYKIQSTVANYTSKKLRVKSIDEIESRYYIRLKVADKHGVLSEISKVFADHKVSIATVLQKETKDNIATIVIIIHKVKEKNLMEAVLRLKKLPVVKKICNIIRVGI
ncbi:hypothetical protein A2230_02150 [candidate division WOR-1 bacterium RIFOXYA2_FULL_36_21]|uniref:Homoserine dehydrogenase n=1 Tax=candidate division WOR-1 bacterium RIFOXYB2_FULL_36_35 TaxID=1802578 RepID=A0A1F4S5Y2_UNCSA|nr:MAG: hypothetical protein A2230_02150 [candidate division WOR-1 bacterium RIFOXYA2_FULL_36_21]OGC15846.1 MAG: hypothetical protein A2290_05875 [candidate division WOR-1 bacterium RIFOXYB2_FULL_36_35]OGC15892.1 MAG: hypothetical protein A2282_04835 [candidate division WOR-1 bacterium RIFOXYA12_FULL_36_13]